jgi:hypothetical protein
MKVSELAEELEVPPSAVLAQCQRFGIDAGWAGAELGGADIVVLRAELASSGPIDLTPTDPVDEPVAVAAPPATVASASDDARDAASADPAVPASPTTLAGASPLPPTAVGSMPELADEITPEPEPDSAPSAPRLPGGHAASSGTPTVGTETVRRVSPPPPPAKRRLDRAVRTSLIALVVAVIAFVASNNVDLAVFVAVLWLVTGLALVVAFVDAFRGRRHASTHPERVSGVWLGSIAMVFAVAGIIGLTVSVLAVTADDPADAPVDLSDLSAVQVARWGYQRTSLLADNGWRQVARDEGSCWHANQRRKDRAESRVEATSLNTSDACGVNHTMEVVKVFAFDRDADSPYPGADQILLAAQQQCAAVFEKILAKVPDATTDVEYPTEVGWSDADHDVACTVSTPDERTGKLPS